jgi:hypothetical protein
VAEARANVAALCGHVVAGEWRAPKSGGCMGRMHLTCQMVLGHVMHARAPKDARACASHVPEDAREREVRGHTWFHAPEDARVRGCAWNIMVARVSA